jgi:hypothetical protein
MYDFMNKLSSYNLFNYLLPGFLFATFAERLTSHHIIQDDIVVTVFLCYFIGMCVSRIGSLIIEPILKAISFVRFAPYPEFVKASQDDEKLEVLSEANNTYRTLLSLFVSLLLLTAFDAGMRLLKVSQHSSMMILCALLALLFAWSYRKQSTYITNRIKAALKE